MGGLHIVGLVIDARVHPAHHETAGGDGRNGAQVFRAAHKADFERLHRHVLERTARLVGHGFFVEGEVVVDFRGVAHIGAGDHCQHMR